MYDPITMDPPAWAIPPNVEPCVERRYFSETYYLALVCDANVLEARLRARPSWRESVDPAVLGVYVAKGRKPTPRVSQNAMGGDQRKPNHHPHRIETYLTG